MSRCFRRCALTLLLAAVLCIAVSATPLDFGASRFDAPPERPVSARGARLTLMFAGDTKLGGRTAQQMAQHGQDYPFGLVAQQLREADVTFLNYESAITSHPHSTPGKPQSMIAAGRAFVFKSDPATSGPILAKAGIDIVQLANNHAMDYGPQGLRDTLAALDAGGISYVGAGPDYASAAAPLVIESQGIRVGYIAWSLIVPSQSRAGADSPGINTLSQDYRRALGRDIGALRQRCDIVVAGFHWGVESTTVPNKLQRDIGHAAIDAGADIVIGTHPHSMQGVEFYKHGVIAYSLGNFVFTGASQRLAGCILRVEAPAEGRPCTVSLLPCWINDGRPAPSDDPRLRQELERIMRATGSTLKDTEDAAGWLAAAPAQ